MTAWCAACTWSTPPWSTLTTSGTWAPTPGGGARLPASRAQQPPLPPLPAALLSGFVSAAGGCTGRWSALVPCPMRAQAAAPCDVACWRCVACRLSIKPEAGTVPKGERISMELAYNPHAPDRLAGYAITCQVSSQSGGGRPEAVRCLPSLPCHNPSSAVAVLSAPAPPHTPLPPHSAALPAPGCSPPLPCPLILQPQCFVLPPRLPALCRPCVPQPRPLARPPAPQILNGHKYELALQGSGYKPKLELSAASHDFGACHVWQPGMAPAVATIRATNGDSQPVSFDVLHTDTEWLQVRRCTWGGGAVCVGRVSGPGGDCGCSACGGQGQHKICAIEGVQRKEWFQWRHEKGMPAALPARLPTQSPGPMQAQVDCGATVLPPGQAKDILVTFKPRAQQRYSEVRRGPARGGGGGGGGGGAGPGGAGGGGGGGARGGAGRAQRLLWGAGWKGTEA